MNNLFIQKASKIHGNKYNYLFVNYINNSTKIKIECPMHGLFLQRPYAHLNGQGCPLCNRNHHKSVRDCKLLTKVCSSCDVEKSISEFYIDRNYYRRNCKQCEKESKVIYRQNDVNKSRIRKYHKKYRNRRRIIDPIYRLRVDVPTIIRRSIKQKYYKDSIWKYLPYSPEQLKRHLEQKFDGEMTWENHGSYWHIDHIIPQAVFHYDTEKHPDFLKCWSFENLRPLKAVDNMKKSSIYNGKRVVNKTPNKII